MFKFNTQGIPDSRQCPIDGVKEVVATCIILRSDPFGFHYPPQGFRKVQVRGIRWEVKEKKSTFLPKFSQFPYFLVSMYARIVKHDERIFLYVQGKGVEVFNDLVRVNTFSRGEPMIAVVPVYHAEDVDPLCLLVSIRRTTGLEPLYIAIATVPMNLLVAVAIVLLNLYVAVSQQWFPDSSPCFISTLSGCCIFHLCGSSCKRLRGSKLY